MLMRLSQAVSGCFDVMFQFYFRMCDGLNVGRLNDDDYANNLKPVHTIQTCGSCLPVFSLPRPIRKNINERGTK